MKERVKPQPKSIIPAVPLLVPQVVEGVALQLQRRDAREGCKARTMAMAAAIVGMSDLGSRRRRGKRSRVT